MCIYIYEAIVSSDILEESVVFLNFVYRSYPEMELVHSIHAHPGNCICIKFEPQGRYFATGSVDALVSVWDAQELYCIKTLSRYKYFGSILA